MNKHGFTGVRKRTDGRAKPYYARLTVGGEYLYTKSHSTAEAAGEEFENARRNLKSQITEQV